MKGFIYIAASFLTVNRSKCGQGGAWIDNDPHFWTQPPTWGICRNDLRRRANVGDYIFYVLPKRGRHPQTIFAYLKIREKITHIAAFNRQDLRSKRMGNKNPNGNIIVDKYCRYNRYDAGAHKRIFHKIKDEYVIGDKSKTKMLSDRNIRSLAPDFISTLSSIIGIAGDRPIDIISRKGRELSDDQVNKLLLWLKKA